MLFMPSAAQPNPVVSINNPEPETRIPYSWVASSGSQCPSIATGAAGAEWYVHTRVVEPHCAGSTKYSG